MNTIEIYDGGYSDEQRVLDQAAFAAKAEAEATALAAKVTARQDVLAKLGLTADEVAALLG
jgi:t-SNARE complex subunit (syntaxin)